MTPTDAESVSIDFRLTWAEFNEAMAGTLRALELGEWELGGLTLLVLRWKFWRNEAEKTVTADLFGVRVVDDGFDPMAYPWSELGLSFETPSLVCVVVTRTAAPIPFAKRVMTNADLAVLRRLISENLVPTPEALAAMRERRIARGDRPSNA